MTVYFSCSMQQGNSGGALVNLDSEVIGVNAVRQDRGLSYSIPINEGKAFIDEYLKLGKPSKLWSIK